MRHIYSYPRAAGKATRIKRWQRMERFKAVGAIAVMLAAFLWTAHGEHLDIQAAQGATEAPETVEMVQEVTLTAPSTSDAPQLTPEPDSDSIGELWGRIQAAAGAAGIDPEAAVRIAACESSLNPKAQNATSTAKGLYQFLDSTWEYIGSPGDPLNSDDAIAAFVEWYPKHPEWWVCK